MRPALDRICRSRLALRLRLSQAIARLRIECQRRRRAKTELRPFFLLFFMRSGSSLLRSLLESHPEISCALEVLDTQAQVGIRRGSRRRALRHLRAWLESLEHEVCGAKVGIHQLQRLGLSLEDLREEFPDARYLILYRESLAEQWVSEKVAEATDEWVYRPEAGRFQGRLRLEAAGLERFIQELRTGFDAMRSRAWLVPCSLWLRYESLVAEPQALMDEQIAPFLGVQPAPVASDLEKQILRPISDVVANYAELRGLLESPRARYVLAGADSVPGDPPA